MYISHTSQKGLDDACVNKMWHCSLKCCQKHSTYGLHNVNKEIILSSGKTSFYATQVHCFMVMDCILIQEVKGSTKKLYFVILSRRKICNISLRFIVHIIYTVITIMGGKLFTLVASSARLRKKDFKPPDKVPRYSV